MNCPKCQTLTRVDLQSLLDCEGLKYRRACVSCSWDVWEVEPGKPADLSGASLALALEAAVADPDPAAASTHQSWNGGRQRPLRRHRDDRHSSHRERNGAGPAATAGTEAPSWWPQKEGASSLAAELVGVAGSSR
jgi:hypothetical protein